MTAVVASTVVRTANNFLLSVGVNTHAAAASGSYGNSSLIKRSLDYLGIHLVRDGFTSVGTGGAVIDALAQGGVKFDFVAPSALPATGGSGLAAYVSGLAAFDQRHGTSIAFLEGLNEANIQTFTTSTNWAAEAVKFQQSLYSAIKGNSSLSDIGVINMSIALESASAYAAIGDLTKYSDFANAHAYTSTLGSLSADTIMEASFAAASMASTGDRLIVTETGYTTYTPYAELGVSELAQAKMTLTGLLNSWENGATNTFLYELLDSDLNPGLAEKERHFGLFNVDGTAKLAATAVHNLTTILSYGSSAVAAPHASFSVGGKPADAHVAALAKTDNVYDLLIWRDAKTWDPISKSDISPASANVFIDLGKVEAVVYLYDPLMGTSPVATYHNVSQIAVPVGGNPLILEVGASSPVTENLPVLPNELVMTADQLVANINSLANSNGYTSITLQGDNVLTVSSVATMMDLINNYGSVLKNVHGGYSFLVVTKGTNWQKEQGFDAKGKSSFVTDKGYNNGLLSSETTVYSDGSKISSNFVGGVLASSLSTAVDKSTLTSTYDLATGLVVRATRRDVDGTVDTKNFMAGALQQEIQINPDGSKLTKNYDNSGAVISQVEVDKAANWLTTHYDPATGKILKWYLDRADNSKECYITGVNGSDYSIVHQVTNSAGQATLVEHMLADGTLVYRQSLFADGTKLVSNYDTQGRKLTEQKFTPDGVIRVGYFDPQTGVLTSNTTKYVDGSFIRSTYKNGVPSTYEYIWPDGRSNYTTFNIQGQSYTEQREKFDASGNLISLLRYHTDRTLDYSLVKLADGSSTEVFFDSTGRKTREINITASGTIKTGTFDPANGALLVADQKYTNGQQNTAIYANGILKSTINIAADGRKVTLTFDTKGQKTSSVTVAVDGSWTTTYFDAPTGAIAKSYLARPDGSSENYADGIAGQSYSKQHQVVNSQGQITAVERWHTDNSWDYREQIFSDGSKIQIRYSAAGAEISETKLLADGTSAVRNFDLATGKISMETVKYADGRLITANYSGNVVTSIDQIFGDKSKLTEKYDVYGHRMQQTLVSAQGDWSTVYYDGASGAVTKAYISRANGSGENFTSIVTGQNYTIQRQVLDASGKVTMVERWHADGTRAYTEVNNSDGSRNLKNYDARGYLLSETIVSSSGSATTNTNVGTVLGSKFALTYGVAQMATNNFGAVHDILDMSRLNPGYSPMTALQSTLSTFSNTDSATLLTASARFGSAL